MADVPGCQTTICGNIKTTQIPSLTTIVSEVHCPPVCAAPVEHYDFAMDGVTPSDNADILILTSGVVKESGNMLMQRVYRQDLWIIYMSILILNILFIAAAISGLNSIWYRNLVKSTAAPYVVGILWIIFAVMAYVSVFMIWENATPDEVPRDVGISVYFLIGSFLSLLWVAVLFQANNIMVAFWVAFALFIYQLWLFMMVWQIKIQAAVFLLPIIILYGYFFYEMIHLAFINDVPL